MRVAKKCGHEIEIRPGRIPNYCDDCLWGQENPPVPSHQPWAVRMFGKPRDMR